MEDLRVSVVVPVLNERDVISGLIQALVGQTRRPDEIVVADGGSTDGTRNELERLLAEHPELIVVDGPGGIAENRNAAIAAATGEVIACTDAGCLPGPHWLEALLEPFAEGADWVAGFYRPDGLTPASTAAGAVMMSVLEEVDIDHFLPGGSSQAFRKVAWNRVGGFPEGTSAGEDTLFGEQMRAAGYRPVFAPEAVVAWHPPATLSEMAAKARIWGEADGRNRVRVGAYLRVILAYWVMPLLALVLALFNPWAGLGLLAALLGLVIYRTRFKYRWVKGASRFLLVPIAHVRQQVAQSYGWLSGFGWRNVVRKISERSLRPFHRWLPRAWRRLDASYRGGVGRAVRHNVDVVLADPRQAARWVDLLPDTYRVRPDREENMPSVLGMLEPRRGREPLIAPVSVDLGSETNAELQPPSTMTADPVALYELLRQTGRRYQLLAAPGGIAGRADPIEVAASLVILAAVPLHDVGGGSRGSQIAQEAVSRGLHVSYVHCFDAAESIDLGLRFIHPLLEEHPLEDFQVDSLLARLGAGPRILLAEFPHDDYRPVVEHLLAAGFSLVYDLIDDWTDASLGAWWYRPEFATWLAARARLLVASAPSLVRSLASQTGREVLELPNAVNLRLFPESDEFAPPPDLPVGDGPVLEYHGSLYGHWFDWEAISRIAEALPDSRVLLIGDRPRQPPLLPANVHLLGLKPQGDLAGYLAHTDVGIIPFVVSDTTHAVSPLKAFEYLAMGVPVAASPLEPLRNLDGVYLDSDLVAAVRRALAAPPVDRRKARADHGWGERLARLLGALDLPLPPAGREVKVERRPVRRYRQEERSLFSPAVGYRSRRP